MRRANVLLITFLLGALILTGCGSSEKKEPGKDENKDNKVTSEATVTKTEDEGGNTDSDDNGSGSTDIGEQKIVLGDLDAENLKVYPEDYKKLSMYYYSASELSDEFFFPEPEEKNGVPVQFNGTVLEENDSVLEYLDLNEHLKQLKGLDTSAKSYKVMTKCGQVILADITPYQSKYYTDSVKDDVYNLRFYKSLLNNLVVYKEFPETGDTAKFYGFYLGYSEQDQCPVFTYGVSNLVRCETFDIEYEKYITDDTKHYKYRNYFEMDYPVGWSEIYEAQSRITYFSLYKTSSLTIGDFDSDGMSMDDVIKMLTGEFDEGMSPDEGMDAPPEDVGDSPENMPPEDMDFYSVKVNKKEKILIGAEKNISAYHLEIGVTRDGGLTYSYETVYVFPAKSAFIMLECVDNSNLNNPDAVEQTDSETADSDLDSENPDGTTETEKTIFEKEIEKILNSIKICGF